MRVFLNQGVHGQETQFEQAVKSYEHDGWTMLLRVEAVDPDRVGWGFVVAKVCQDEIVVIRPRGHWRQLPTVIFATVGGKDPIVREAQ